MPIEPYAPPPPVGTITPGNLYADMPNRTLWLGVDSTVDPLGAVLIADILATMVAIDTAEANANAYTDVQIATRAPLSHTHTASQVTDFNAAVDARIAASSENQFLAGMIVLYGGTLATIGVGDLADWALCNGAAVSRTTYADLFAKLGTAWGVGNGSTTFNLPDLRNNFVFGAGHKVVGTKNINTEADTNTTGAHSHTAEGTALSVGHLPAHTHSVTGTATGSGTTGAAGKHGHPTRLSAVFDSSPTKDPTGGFMLDDDGTANYPAHTTTTPGDPAGDQIGQAPDHTHSFSASLAVTGTAANTGSGDQHTHNIQSGGSHAHTISSAELRDALPSYAVAYIIKLT